MNRAIADAPVVLITGASRGIGAATAVLAAERGYSVCVNYRHDADAARAVVDSIVACGRRAIAVQADVAEEAQVEHLFKQCDERLGVPRALVNNAGVLEQQMSLVTMTLPRLQRVFATNVFGTLLCAREAVRRMSTAHGGMGGAIVNVSSAAARIGAPGEYVDYAASKGAVDTFTLGLAKEVADQGIRVNAVRPGFIHTDIHARGGDAGRVARLRNSIPLGRGGEPIEVARAILWLLSPEAAYTSGTFIDVSGGR